MQTISLKPLLAPDSVAIVGASNKEGTIGFDAVEMILRGGYEGEVYPINPRYEEVQGLRCYPDLNSLAHKPELTLLCVAAHRLEQQVEAVIQAGTRAVVVTANAILPDDSSPNLAERVRSLCNRAGIPMCGHNAMGFYNNDIKLRACGFTAPDEGTHGNITLISHSGSIFSTLAHNDPQLRFNLAITTGCETVTTAAQYLHYALAQPTTSVIGLYLESIREPELFIAGLRQAAQQRVPVVAMKSGRSALGARFALSHSGGLAGDDDALQAVFDRYGVIRTKSLDELANTLLLFSRYPHAPSGNLVAIADSGGERNVLADDAEHVGVEFSVLGDTTLSALAEIQEFGQEAANPLDPWGTGLDFINIFGRSMAIMLADPNAAIGVFSQDLRDGYFLTEGCLNAIDYARTQTDKPIAFLTNFSGTRRSESTRMLDERGIPVMSGTRDALHAIKNWLAYRDYVYSPPPHHELHSNSTLSFKEGDAIPEHAALAVLDQAGIPVVPSTLINDETDLEAAIAGLEYPLVLKTAVEGVLHKTDAGGVILNIRDASALRSAYNHLSRQIGKQALIQPMITPDRELILGMKTDPTFGPLIIVGAGGVFTEILQDRFTMLPDAPISEIEQKLTRLRIFRILQGVRGAAAVDLDQLIDIIFRFAQLCENLTPTVAEIDINPLHVSAHDILALDALIIRAGAIQR